MEEPFMMGARLKLGGASPSRRAADHQRPRENHCAAARRDGLAPPSFNHAPEWGDVPCLLFCRVYLVVRAAVIFKQHETLWLQHEGWCFPGTSFLRVSPRSAKGPRTGTAT